MMPTSAEGMDSPYRGLTPFTEDDARYFFGREVDTRNIAANLEVARLTLFYGPSGVGKSSVLRAGVLHQRGEVRAFALAAEQHRATVAPAGAFQGPCEHPPRPPVRRGGRRGRRGPGRGLQPEHGGVADGVDDGVPEGRAGQVAGATPREGQRHPERDVHDDQFHDQQRQRQPGRDGQVPQPPEGGDEDGRPPSAPLAVVVHVGVQRSAERPRAKPSTSP